ncbi:hypothetical protein FGO68_gene3058 [Halteria grandinella]|uniref:Uncharacterized protein n=1 Tax=Halteria grandinella TaxID=5974 RepID=A0A8J8NGV2_HALGN|nr:hypothetical protein FGO68_gene3058 [Halteria grandinella]
MSPCLNSATQLQIIKNHTFSWRQNIETCELLQRLCAPQLASRFQGFKQIQTDEKTVQFNSKGTQPYELQIHWYCNTPTPQQVKVSLTTQYFETVTFTLIQYVLKKNKQINQVRLLNIKSKLYKKESLSWDAQALYSLNLNYLKNSYGHFTGYR